MNHISELQKHLPDRDALSQPTVHVEVCQNSTSSVKTADIKRAVEIYLQGYSTVFRDAIISTFTDPFLKEHVHSISIYDADLCFNNKQVIELQCAKLHIYVYQLNQDGPSAEEVEDEDISAANHWMLPASEFDGLWDSLVFDTNVKQQLLQYAMTTLMFSDRKIDCNIISWNRVILLHGPPGTGKTSLCKALAQKLTIRLSSRYSYGQLIEINSHSLFSKWFSESGKLVMKMFQKIQELVDDPEVFVCVLIDEVESLTAARKSAMSGNEPSDAIRVVNALLTQLDQIKRNPNVIILTTSNVTGAIDLAFVDRADIKQYIGPPSPAAIYKIYQSCLYELMRTGFIDPEQCILDLRALELMKLTENDATKLSLYLRTLSQKSQGLSGRTLRKLPFLAHAFFIQASSSSLENFLDALSRVIDKQFAERIEMRDIKTEPK